MATRKLSKERKYAIADAIAGTYEVDPVWVEQNYRYLFGCVLNNAQFKVKGKVYTLRSFCKSEDDALHITSLVIRRLKGRLVQRDIAQVE